MRPCRACPQPRRAERHLRGLWHRQQLRDAGIPPREGHIPGDGEERMRSTAASCDHDGPIPRLTFGLAGAGASSLLVIAHTIISPPPLLMQAAILLVRAQIHGGAGSPAPDLGGTSARTTPDPPVC